MQSGDFLGSLIPGPFGPSDGGESLKSFVEHIEVGDSSGRAVTNPKDSKPRSPNEYHVSVANEFVLGKHTSMRLQRQ